MNIKHFFLFFFLTIGNGLLHAQTDPVNMLQQAADDVILALQSNEDRRSDLDYINQLITTKFLPHIDVDGMARSSVGKKVWNTSSEVQRHRFSEALMQLVIRTYAKALAKYTDEVVKFYPLRESAEHKRFVQVRSVIVRSQASNIPLTYSLVLKDNRWEIYDLSVEGVSLLQSFKTQFAAELSQGSFDDLISKISQQGAQSA